MASTGSDTHRHELNQAVTGNLIVDNTLLRFDFEQATDAQVLELADMVEPYTANDPAVTLYWLKLLLATQ